MRVRAAVVAAWLACGLVTHPAGQDGPGAPLLVHPTGLALDTDGTLYVSDNSTHRILKLAGGRLTVVAGTGEGGFSGDGGPAMRAKLFAPDGIAFDADRRLLVADTYNHRVRRIDRDGVITTIAGTGTAAATGDGGLATAASLNGPQDVAVDRDGHIFIADTYNALVRRIDGAGVITTVAGSEPGLGGDGGPATRALLNMPTALAVAADGAIYVSDAANSRVRRIAADGTIATVLGTGAGSGLGGAGYAGDGGPSNQGKAFSAMGLQINRAGHLYVSDSGNNRVRVVRDGIVTTLAGSGTSGFGGDGATGTAAMLNTPHKIAAATDGRVFVADRANGRVRVIDANGSIRTVAGGSDARVARLPADHEPIARRQRAERAINEVTASVAAALPPAAGATPLAERTLIDRHLFAAWTRDRIPHAALAGDFEFARRVFLDLTGRIPATERLLSFVRSTAPDKRDRLIDELLDSPAWADFWTYWYGDLLRVTHNRVGNASMKHFDAWLRQSFRDDKPYNRLVTELLTASAPDSNWLPDAAPSTFLARWYVAGATMYTDQYEDTADEIFVQSARLFLGVNYQCVSCHNGKAHLEKVDVHLTTQTRRDFWSMAAFFGGTRVRAVRYQDRFIVADDGTGYDTKAASTVRLQRSGPPVQPTFLLTGERADTSKPLRPQFARMLTSHPQFARATVNLIWKQFFGLGIVEPVDGFDLARQDPRHPPPSGWAVQPTDPALLDALARDFADHDFSLKHLMRTIARSSAYQLSSRFDGEWQERYTPYFARKLVKRLSAEQLHDAICQATGVFGDYARRDLVYNTPLPPVHFWTEVSTPEEIGNREAKTFLEAFGLANREQFDRQDGGSVGQAMMLMNSAFVTRRVRAEGGSRVQQLIASAKTSGEIVDELFLATLSRYPTLQEKNAAVRWLDADRVSASDLHWVLLNKVDFVFNY
jgi:sugar lactone lactonase YvrE